MKTKSSLILGLLLNLTSVTTHGAAQQDPHVLQQFHMQLVAVAALAVNQLPAAGNQPAKKLIHAHDPVKAVPAYKHTTHTTRQTRVRAKRANTSYGKVK